MKGQTMLSDKGFKPDFERVRAALEFKEPDRVPNSAAAPCGSCQFSAEYLVAPMVDKDKTLRSLK